MKLLLVYSTKFGNCRGLCEELATRLQDKHTVNTGNVKDLKPKDIAGEPPDGLIVGSRVIIGSPDRASAKFVKKLGSILDSPIPRAAVFYTHGGPWKDGYEKMSGIVTNAGTADHVLETPLSIKLQSQKGPREPGQEKKVDEFIDKLDAFLVSE